MWDLEKTIKVVWTAELIDEQELRFNQQWEVTVVNVKAWDTVKKWDIIAELDQTDVENSIKQSQISLSNSRLKLQALLDEPDETQVIQAQNSIKSTKDNLAVSKQELEKLKQTQETDVANSEKNIEIARQELEKLKTDADTNENQKEVDIQLQQKQVSQKQDSLDLANSQLVLLKKQQWKNLWDSTVNYDKKLSDAVSDVRWYTNDFDKLIENIDIIFGISDKNKWKNDSYEVYLSAKNISLKSEVQNDYYEIQNLFADCKSSYNTISSKTSYSKEEILTLLNKYKTLFSKMMEMWDVAKNAMYATISSSSYTESTINSQLSTVTSFYSQAQSNYNAINSTINSLQTTDELSLLQEESSNTITKQEEAVQSAELDLKNAQQSLKTLEDALEQLKTQNDINIKTKETSLQKLQDDLTNTLKTNQVDLTTKQNSISSLENSLVYAEANLKDIQDGASSEEIQQAKNDIANQELSLENTKKSLDKYKIEAPFDGSIRKIDFKVWDKITSDEEKYVYVENPDLLQMTALLDQIDIANVEIWQDVRIVFDSFSDKTLTWTVTDIDSTPTTSSWVTSYTVKVTLDKGELDLYSGMTAVMYIIIEQANDVVVIPSSYITEEGDSSTVLVKSWVNKATRKLIETWLTDWTNTQVLTWVSEGDTLIQMLSWTTSSSSSTTSLFGPWSNRKSSSSWSSSNSSWWGQWWGWPWGGGPWM